MYVKGVLFTCLSSVTLPYLSLVCRHSQCIQSLAWALITRQARITVKSIGWASSKVCKLCKSSTTSTCDRALASFADPPARAELHANFDPRGLGFLLGSKVTHQRRCVITGLTVHVVVVTAWWRERVKSRYFETTLYDYT